MDSGIIVTGLSKTYGNDTRAALSNLSIAVRPGEIYGYLGANGAGKSTTLRLLLNFLKPSSGTATIMGLDCFTDSVEAKKHIGYLSGDVALYGRPTGRQLLDYLSGLYPAAPHREVLQKRFSAELDKPIYTLSRGNRQKLGIIQAFMCEPDVLILDEPTSGLDPLMQEAFYETLDECRSRGAAILMSSHVMSEAQRICDRIGIIRHGKLVHEQEIKDDGALGAVLFKVTFAAPAGLSKASADKALKMVSKTDKQTALFTPVSSISGALKAFGAYDIKEFSTQAVDLENEFLEYYGDDG